MIIVFIAFYIQGLVCSILKGALWFSDNIAIVSYIIVFLTSIVFSLYVLYCHKCCNSSSNVHSGFSKYVTIIILIGYFIRLFLIIWDVYFASVFPLPHSGADTERFFGQAVEMYTGNLEQGGMLYSSFLNSVFQLFGIQRIVAQYYNVLFGVSSVLIALKILGKYKVDEFTKKVFITIGMLIPDYAVLNSILLRESIIVFLLTGSLFFFVTWVQDNRFIGFIFSIVLSLIAAAFHSGLIAVAIGYATCPVLFDRRKDRFRFSKTTVFLVICCVFVCFVIINQSGDLFTMKFSDVDAIEDITEFVSVARGGSAYSALITTGNTVVDIIISTPLRVFYFTMSPLPWDWRGLNDIIAFVFSSVFYGYCYYLAFKTLRSPLCKNWELITSLLFIISLSTFVFAWGVGNAGTALRHRDKLFIPCLLMFSFCIEKREKQTYNGL